jgi:uncharacterized integral membrane protein
LLKPANHTGEYDNVLSIKSIQTQRGHVKPRAFLLVAATASLFFNVIILVLVVLNNDWVKTRAAGGQFTDFPLVIRFIYFIMALLTISLLIWLWRVRNKALTQGQQKFAKYVSYLFFVSTVFQLISRSPDERWNAIPAIIIAITLLQIQRTSKPATRAD